MSGLQITLPIRDIADMWIHEGFTTYSENLYLDYHYGKQASLNMLLEREEVLVILKQ